MEQQIKKESASYTIVNGANENQKKSVDINLTNKQFTIEDKSGVLRNKGISISIGGATDLDALKDLLNSINSAVKLIEDEFEALLPAPEEPNVNDENNQPEE